MIYDSREFGGFSNYATSSAAAMHEQNMLDSRRRNDMLVEQKNESLRRKTEYRNFIENAMDLLLTEALYSFVDRSLPKTATREQKQCAEHILYNFVHETGARTLIKEYATKSKLLAGLSGLVSDTYDKVVKETNTDEVGGYNIKPGTSKDFYSALCNLSDDAMCKKIAGRVEKATTEFIQKQVEDNTRIEDLAQKAQEKINSVKGKDIGDKVAEEQANYVHAIEQRVRYSRPRSVFEEMVYAISEKAVKDDVVRESAFVTENGRFSVQAAIDVAKVMYTVLECMNTFRFKDITKADILPLIEGI